MNYVKSFWTSTPSTSGGEVISAPPTAVHTAAPSNYNSVTFTTTTATSGNSKIIITTVPSQNSQQILYHTPSKSHQHHHHQHHQAEMATSPNESYHSAASTLEHQSNGNDGGAKLNHGYTGSNSEINNNNGVSSHAHNQVVHREQYWSWNWPWLNWNQREKIFLIVIVILSLCVLTLTSLLSVVLQQNLKQKETLLRNGLSAI